MADSDDSVTLAEAKTFLQLQTSDTSEDAVLDDLIVMARTRLESELPFGIATKTLTVITECHHRVELKGRVDKVETVERTVDFVTTDITDECTIDLDDLYTPYDMGRVEVTYIQSGYCPQDIKMALLIMIRNLYTNREQDPYTDTVRVMTDRYREVNA